MQAKTALIPFGPKLVLTENSKPNKKHVETQTNSQSMATALKETIPISAGRLFPGVVSPWIKPTPAEGTQSCYREVLLLVLPGCWYCFRFWIQCAKLRKSMQKNASDSEPSVPNRFKAMPSWTAGSPMKTGVKQIAPTMMKARNCGLANPPQIALQTSTTQSTTHFAAHLGFVIFIASRSLWPFEVPCTMKRAQWRKSMSLSLCCTLKY